MLPTLDWTQIPTKDDLDARLARLESRFDRKIQELTRTLMLGLVGSMFTMTSLFLGVIALVV